MLLIWLDVERTNAAGPEVRQLLRSLSYPVELHQATEISWCAEHRETDIRVRQYGELSCPRWHPDDECVIVKGRVVVSPEDLAAAEKGLGIPEAPRTTTDGEPRPRRHETRGGEDG